MDINKAKKVYFMGIGGIGISGLAKLLKWQGKEVIGSDLGHSEVTDDLEKEEIKVFYKQKANNVPKDADFYVYSSAVPEDNPERKKIRELGFQEKELSYFAAVGEIMKDYDYSIAISGTHGKTTTAAMLAAAMVKAKLDPTMIIGSKVKQLDSNARLGKNKKYFVIEACEHQEHMMELNPKVIILTNIEEDHLDYYRDLEHIELTFQKYINKLPEKEGLLVKNEDDSEGRDLGFDGDILSYGIDQEADVMAKNIKVESKIQYFTVGKNKYTLQIPGQFNIYNALAVIAFLTKKLKVKPEYVQKALADFTGTWRRFELLGNYKGATVVSDYAHHPTALNGVLKAVNDFYPERRVVLIFQPHQHNRTKKLFKQFTQAFDHADFIILQEIYDVPGREADTDQDISARDLARAVEKRGKYIFYSENAKKTKEMLEEHIERNDVILIAGAGDIYLLAEELVSKQKK